MTQLSFDGTGIYLEKQNQRRVLLNFTDYLGNKSRVQLNRSEKDHHPVLQEILSGLYEKAVKYNAAAVSPHGDRATDFFLLLIMVSRELLKTSKPVRILEMGSGDGVFSALLTELMGRFHDRSRLYCLSDILDPFWLDNIATADNACDVNYLAANYCDTGLQKESFDLVIINGFTYFEEPGETLREAMSLLKDGGVLLCHTVDNPLMEATLRLYFEKREEYCLTKGHLLQTVIKHDCSWRIPDPSAHLTEIDQLLQLTHDWIKTGNNYDAGRKLNRELDSSTAVAVQLDDRQRKRELIAAREALINKLLRMERSVSAI